MNPFRLLVPLLLAFPIAAGAQAPHATGAQAPLDPSNPDDVVTINRKVNCSSIDEKPAYYWWAGKAYSRIPGEKDRVLFDVIGMNARQCVSVIDDERGEGYRMVSREIMLYLDPATGARLDEWENPFTGDTNEVLHVANDPVNMPGFFPIGRDGDPVSFRGTVQGNTVLQNIQVPLYYTNPLGGAYQTSVGGIYHAMEMFNYWTDADQLFDPADDNALSTRVGWARVAQWLPWMKMGNRAGLMVFHAAGQKEAGIEDLPQILQDALATEEFELYREPPPVDDTRPNETSWTYYKKLRDGENPGRH